MAGMLPIKTRQLKAPDRGTIQEMVLIYQAAYKGYESEESEESDEHVQLNPKNIPPGFMDRMAETIANRVNKPAWEFIVATNESSTRILGWLALAFKHSKDSQLSEEHVLFAQYALLPDMAVKAKSEGISTDEVKKEAHSLFEKFQEAREEHLPDKHCIISTMVVRPKFQNRGIASALLTKAINRSEVSQFPIWVQAPGACQDLFHRHGFEEVGAYPLDLNDLRPEGQGKKKATSTLGKYVWKFMVRKEPLEEETRAYQSSTHFAAHEAKRAAAEHTEAAGAEAEQKTEETRVGKGKEPAHGKGIAASPSKASAKTTAEPGTTEQLHGKAQQAAGGENEFARSAAEAGPSTPLLTKPSSSKGGRKAEAKEKAAREKTYS